MPEHSVETSRFVVSVRRRADSASALRSILVRLKHLDLTGKIRFESAVMKTHGGYADVFVGFATLERLQEKGEIKVAIKRLRVHIQGDYDFAKSLSKEIRVWSRLGHPNVLAFLGYALEGEDYPLLISEWMENGTAMSFVNKNPACDITHMILGIAEGLAYLHSQGVIHADMKADNVLVSADGQPRICDFGISSILAASATFGATSSHNYGTRGSLRWMAIEFFEMMDPPVLHSEKTDIWAFGMTAYELITKQLPYAHIKLDPQVLLAIMQGILPSQPEFFSRLPENVPERRMWNICCACWKKSPETRPSMSNIVHTLTTEQASNSHSSEVPYLKDSPMHSLLEVYRDPIRAEDTNAGLNSSSFVDESLSEDSGDYEDPPSGHLPRMGNHEREEFTTATQVPSTRPFEVPLSYDRTTKSSSNVNSAAYGWNTGKPWRVRFESPPPSPVAGSSSSSSLVFAHSSDSLLVSRILPDDNVILKEGYLAEVTDDPVSRVYSTRYYILRSSSLNYYRRNGGELLGTINIIGAQLPDEAGRKRGYQNALLLIAQRSMGLSDEASLRILYAEDLQECREWVSALQQMASNSEGGGGDDHDGRFYKLPSAPAVEGFGIDASRDSVSASTSSVDAYQKGHQGRRKGSSRLFSIFRRLTS